MSTNERRKRNVKTETVVRPKVRLWQRCTNFMHCRSVVAVDSHTLRTLRDTGTEHVRFFTEQARIARNQASANRREVFGESHEG